MQIPSSTYRVQFHHGFTFLDLAGITDYLAELGITAVYGSPILAAVKGSEHGYDGIDSTKLNPEIGTIEDLRSVATKLRSKGIGWIQDIVPNHLAFHTDNPWIYDVLERGINSSYAQYFDIDWEHPFYTHKLMTPFLEKDAAACVAEKKILLQLEESGFSLKYGDNRFPVQISSYKMLMQQYQGEKKDILTALCGALEEHKDCPHYQWTVLKQQLLNELNDPEIRASVNTQLQHINNDQAAMMALLDQQHYVLCAFYLTDKEINYRRFFNINALISLRMEDEQVFNHCHRFIYELFREGLITGLRIDHIDGLKSPGQYIDRLRKLFGKDCYIIIEKILDIKEQLPPLDVQGTSGYEFLSYVNQLMTDSEGAAKLESLYRQYVPGDRDYYRLVFDNKLNNLKNSLNGDWENLVRQLLGIKMIKDQHPDEAKLKEALGVFMASYPVYRAYIDGFPISESDREMIEEAFQTAGKYHPELSTELEILKQLFTLDTKSLGSDGKLAFLQRLMQFTGPMSAKGVEDTTFYQYNVLISHNEVGDSPCVLGIPAKTFHEKMKQRILQNPLSMNSTSTHDTKRGEDARIRINLISELTDEWRALIENCRKIAEPLRRKAGEIMAPDINDEYFLYQSLIGSLPENGQIDDTFINRTKNFFIKALRESKLNTNHTYPNTAYEEVCLEFIGHLLAPQKEFLPLLSSFVKKLLPYARIYSLAQVIMKMTAPGIPDIYRGCELWDNSYVDPDNRRAVDFDLRKEILQQLKADGRTGEEIITQWSEDDLSKGVQKFYVTHKLLKLRKEYPLLFSEGNYIAVPTDDNGRSAIAYLRHHADEWLLVILPLGIVQNEKTSVQIKLPDDVPASWTNVFTGQTIATSGLDTTIAFNTFPVAVLKAIAGE